MIISQNISDPSKYWWDVNLYLFNINYIEHNIKVINTIGEFNV